MATWSEFAAAAPDLAAQTRRLFYRTEVGQALLATVRGDDLPRIHPIYVAVMEDRLLAFANPSPKLIDLATDGRFALHNHQDPAAPDEIQLRGRVLPVDDPEELARFTKAWYFETTDEYRLFEFLIEHALLGERSPDDWPPRYTSWKSSGEPRPG
jgi:hypothetical protein